VAPRCLDPLTAAELASITRHERLAINTEQRFDAESRRAAAPWTAP
jgi:hypothetical protein